MLLRKNTRIWINDRKKIKKVYFQSTAFKYRALACVVGMEHNIGQIPCVLALLPDWTWRKGRNEAFPGRNKAQISASQTPLRSKEAWCTAERTSLAISRRPCPFHPAAALENSWWLGCVIAENRDFPAGQQAVAIGHLHANAFPCPLPQLALCNSEIVFPMAGTQNNSWCASNCEQGVSDPAQTQTAPFRGGNIYTVINI